MGKKFELVEEKGSLSFVYKRVSWIEYSLCFEETCMAGKAFIRLLLIKKLKCKSNIMLGDILAKKEIYKRRGDIPKKNTTPLNII